MLKKIVRITITQRAQQATWLLCRAIRCAWATCLKPTEELVHFLNKNSIGLLGCHQLHVVRDRRGARLHRKRIPFQRQAHHGMHEAIVQWRIIVVFKQQKNYDYRPSHPSYSPSSSPCCAVNNHPVSFLYSRGRASSSKWSDVRRR